MAHTITVWKNDSQCPILIFHLGRFPSIFCLLKTTLFDRQAPLGTIWAFLMNCCPLAMPKETFGVIFKLRAATAAAFG